VGYSIFSNNGNEFAGGGFVVSHCVFSNALSTEFATFVATTDIAQNSATASHALVHLDTLHCPITLPATASPRMSPRPSRSRSPSPSATQSCRPTGLFGVAPTSNSYIYMTSTRDCWIIVDCVFFFLRGSMGGAFRASGEGHLRVIDSTFFSCSGDMGGAISFYAGELDVTGSCFSNCSADYEGSAIIAEGPSLIREFLAINTSTFVRCDSRYATLLAEIPPDCDTLNFTHCSAWMSGSVVWTLSEITSFSFTYGTVSQCNSTRHFEFRCYGIAMISYCNFYSNYVAGVSSSYALIVPLASGTTEVSFCIFSDNGKEFGGISSNQFRVQNCVFSGDLPTISYIATTGNSIQASTASHAISHLDTYLCPAPRDATRPPPSKTPVRTAVPTEEFTNPVIGPGRRM
jgi:hypothetical protein